MKLLSVALAVLVTITAFANDEIYVYTNDSGCTVEVSRFGNSYLINGAKQVRGKTEQAQASIMQDLSSAEITSYCSEYNKENTTVSLNGDDLVISCLNKRGKVTTDLDESLNLTKLNFEGYHYYFLLKKDDSFSCENLTLSEILEA